MSFSRLAGQERLAEFLKGAIAGDRLAHALLLVGPPGSGKRTLAREIGKALLCQRRAGDACDACRDCRLIERDNHPDFTVFAREAEHSFVRIETVRALTGALALKPFGGRRKVAVVPEAHLLTESAANALLKTLEEPPGESVVLLLANSAADLLPTILSRCQVLAMRPLRPETLADLLVRAHGASPEAARYAALMAGGTLGRALELLRPEWYDIKRWVVERFSSVTLDTAFEVTDELAAWAGRLGQTPAATREVLAEALSFAAALYRDQALGEHAPPVHADQAERRPVGLDPLTAMDLAERLLRARSALEANAHPGLAVDAALIEIARRRGSAAAGRDRGSR